MNLPSTSALNASFENKCIYCEKVNSHKVEDCQELSVLERKDKLKKMGRCFLCLGRGHVARFCKVKNKYCGFCNRRHHTSICNAESESMPSTSNEPRHAVLTSSLPSNAHAVTHDTVLLQTADVTIENRNKSVTVRCLLDGGSQKTFILEEVSRKLNLKVIGEEVLSIHTFGTNAPIDARLRRVKLVLKNALHPTQQIEIEALETPTVCTAVVNVPGKEIRETMKLKGLQLADTLTGGAKNGCQLSLLIGADYYWKVVSGRVERLQGELVALETIFGWCVQGPTTVSSITCAAPSIGVMKAILEDKEDLFQLQKFWEIESLGIVDKTNTYSNADEEALKHFNASIQFKSGRYEVGLPWKTEHVMLSDNFTIAKKRLYSLARRFKSDPLLYDRYDKVISEQKKRGIVEEGTNQRDEISKTYYLPHHAVIKEEKDTTKTRVVFDASSHEKDYPSLNNCLYQGPNLNPDLLTVLLKFREHKIALMADIEQAFLQISLAVKDRDAVRFLWIDGSLNDSENLNFKILRMTRVLFGVTSSPFLLTATLKHHFKKYEAQYPQTCELLENYLYVDDFIAGAETVDNAFQISVEAKEILSKASMNLRKWKTNSSELRSQWQTMEMENAHEDYRTEDLGRGKTPLKVLGMSWDPETDILVFDLNNLLTFLIEKQNTKRFVLQTSARIFDPMGFLTPFLIRVKCLFQRLWERGVKWDDELPTDLQESWDAWCLELPRVQDIKIPRYYFCATEDVIINKQLHGFCDASQKAYGAVIYIRYVTVTHGIVVSFVTSKSRVAPLKKLTLPRLELMGALIGARLISYLKTIFEIEDTDLYSWSDSTIALHWIRGSSARWKPFVANRVVEIQAITDTRI